MGNGHTMVSGVCNGGLWIEDELTLSAANGNDLKLTQGSRKDQKEIGYPFKEYKFRMSRTM